MRICHRVYVLIFVASGTADFFHNDYHVLGNADLFKQTNGIID